MNYWNDGTDYLMHHGIKGQKWGIRNYQYEDGTLTPEGRERYGKLSNTNANSYVESSTFEQRKSIEKNKLTKKYSDRMNAAMALPFALGAAGAVTGLAFGGPISASAGFLAGWASGVIGAGISSVTMSSMLQKKLIDIDEKYLAAKEAEIAASNLQVKQKQEKEARISKAKKEDAYDINFLEAIQNSKILYDGDKKALINEYSKYLDNPEKYFTEDSLKLKTV